jgi:mannosyltransferase
MNSIIRINLISDWITHHRFILCLTFIVFVSIFLRFYNLGTESLWLDETVSIKESSLTIQGMATSSNQPPLYFLLLHNWIFLFGSSEIALRSLSAFFGVLFVIVIFLTGNALYNKRVGLISAFLSSFAYAPIYYSQEARSYSLLLLLSTLSYWFFIEILLKDRIVLYFAYIISSILLIFTHFYGLFIITSQVIFILIYFKKYKSHMVKYSISLSILLVSAIPMLWLIKDNAISIATTGFWIQRPGIVNLFITFGSFFGKYNLYNYFLCVVFGLCLVLGIASQLNSANKSSNQMIKSESLANTKLQSNQKIIILLLWLCIPVIIPFIESVLLTPIYISRYVIGVYPAICILVSIGLININKKWIFYPILALIIVLSSFILFQYYKNDVKQQWREAAQFIETNSFPNDVIIIFQSYNQTPFNYYYKGLLKEEEINSVNDALFLRSSIIDSTIYQKRLWLVLGSTDSESIESFKNYLGKDSVDLTQKYIGVTIILFSY